MMNPFKNVFRSKKAKSLDLLSNFVRASKSTSSISVESVDLDANASTEASEWDTEAEDDKTVEKEEDNKEDESVRCPVPADVEPDWSSLPLVTFSREVYEAQREDNAHVQPYCNLVLVVVADLHRVLSLKLPRYIVALMSNYRYLNGTSGNLAQVQQMDLYLTNVQEYLDVIGNLEAFEYQKMLHNCCKAISVLASILELCAVRASRDIFFLSFQQQSIAAFGMQYLCEFNVQIEYLEYLLPDSQKPDRAYDEPEVDLADTATQTETVTTLPVIVEEPHHIPDLVNTQVQTDPQDRPHFPPELYVNLTNDTVQTYSRLFQVVLDDYSNSILRKLAQMQACIQRVDNAKEYLAREVHQKDDYLRRLLQELVTRDGDLSSIKNDKLYLQRRLSDVQTSHEKLYQEKESLMGDLSCSRNQTAELSDRVRQLEEENVRLAEERLHVTGDLSDMLLKTEEHCQELAVQNDELVDKVGLLEDEVSEAKEDMQHFDGVVDELKEQKEQGKALEERVRSLQADLHSQGLTLQLSQEENATLLSRCATLESHGNNSQHAVSLAVRKKDELLRKLQAALAAAIADGNEMRSDICELKKQRKTFNLVVRKNEESIQALQNSVATLQGSVAEKDGAILQLEQFLQSQAQELTTASQRIQLKEEAILTLQHKLEQSKNHIGSLQATHKTLEDSIDEILQQSNTLQVERDNLQELVRDLSHGNAVLREELVDMTARCNQLERQQVPPLLDFATGDTVALDQAKAQIERLQNDLGALQKAQTTRLAGDVSWAATQTDTVDKKRKVSTLSTQTDDHDVDESVVVVEKVAAEPAYPVSEDEHLRQRLKILQAQLEEGRNVLRATEYGKECLALKVSGLQSDNKACEARIKELESTLSNTLTTHSEESEFLQSDFQAKLYDARCRLAQKGQELEFARVNSDKLIKRSEELSSDLARCISAKNQAEQRLILLKDQASREVDELELQIKDLRAREEERAAQFEHKQTWTDLVQSQVSLVQTSVSFQYGYDLESGARLRVNDLYVSAICHKDVQTVPQANTSDMAVQVNPSTVTVLTQTNVENRGFAAQTDEADIITKKVSAMQTEDVDADTRFTQTDEVETTNVLCQTLEENQVSTSYSFDLLKLTPSLLDIDSGPAAVGRDLNVVQPQASFSWPIASVLTQLPSSSLSAIGQPFIHNQPSSTNISTYQAGDYRRLDKIQETKPQTDLEKADVATSVASFQTGERTRTPLRRSVVRHKKLIKQPGKTSKNRKGTQAITAPPRSELWSTASDTVEEDGLSPISQVSSSNLSVTHTGQSTAVSVVEKVKRPSLPVELKKTAGPLQDSQTAPAISAKSSLHDICQFLYDIMSKDATTRHLLIDISNGLDYTLKDTLFDRQFSHRFLRAYDKHHILRALLLTQQGSGIGNVPELIHKLRTLTMSPSKNSTLEYPTKFERRNDPEVAEELKRFFTQFISNEEKGPLEDFNGFFARCFVLLAPASRNLRKTFHNSCAMVSKMPDEQRHIAFATLALKFSVRSHKLRDIVHYETGRDPEQTFQKYRLALDRRKQSTGLDYVPSRSFTTDLLGLRYLSFSSSLLGRYEDYDEPAFTKAVLFNPTAGSS